MKLFGNSKRRPEKAGTEAEAKTGTKRRKLSGAKKAGIALGVVLVVAVGAVAGYLAWEKPPERANAGLVDATKESTAPAETDGAEDAAEPTAAPTEDPNAGAPPRSTRTCIPSLSWASTSPRTARTPS